MMKYPAALLCLVLVAGCSNVTIGRNEENPARHPFQGAVTIVLNPGVSTGFGQFAVPTGKELVIEYLSADAGVQAGSGQNFHVTLQLDAGGVGMQSFVGPLAFIGRSPVGIPTDLFTMGRVVRLYADPSSPVIVGATRTNGSAGEAFVNVRVVGHLVPVP